MQKLVLQILYTFFIRLFLKVVVGVKFDDSGFLLNESQFIIVANHNSHLDTMALMASLPRKIVHKVKPVAAADYFGKTKLQERFSNFFINTLLIRRKRDKGNPENDPIQRMIRALDEGYSLILFPEGTRGEPEKLQSLKPGVGIILSKRPSVKYVPVFMTGMGKVMPKGDPLIVPFNAAVRFGKPTNIQAGDVDAIMEGIESNMMALKDTLGKSANS